MKKAAEKKTEFVVEYFDFYSLDQVPSNPQPSHFRLEPGATVNTNLQALWQNIVQSKTALPIAFVLHEGENNNKEIISTNFLKPYIENQNHENLLISTEMCK